MENKPEKFEEPKAEVMTYEEYAEVHHDTPYVFEIESGDKKISYFGAEAETLRKVLVTGAAIIFGVYAIFRAFSEVGNLNSATPPSIIGHFNKILMLFLAALPVIFINVSGGSIEFVFLDFTGLALFAIGFFLEIRGSKFGQPLIWIGFFLLSLSVPYGFVSAASTLLVLVFLLKYKMFPAIAI